MSRVEKTMSDILLTPGNVDWLEQNRGDDDEKIALIATLRSAWKECVKLRKALRNEVIVDTSTWGFNETACRLCLGRWHPRFKERHKPGCLLGEKEAETEGDKVE
jgi:hypothetical protein